MIRHLDSKDTPCHLRPLLSVSDIDGVSECVKHGEINECFLNFQFYDFLIKFCKLKFLKIFMKDVFKTLGELGGTFFGGTLGERGCVPPSSPGKKNMPP